MDISPKDAITLLVCVLSFVAIYLVQPAKNEAKAARERVAELFKQYNDFRVEVAKNYVSHEHLDKALESVTKSLDEIKAMIKESKG